MFDHNAVVSAFLKPDSAPAWLLDEVLRSHIAVTTNEILVELAEVSSRSKFNRYLSADERHSFVLNYADRCQILEVSDVIAECRDPDDDKFLALAFVSEANFIISGDIHLIEMNPWRGIPILKPQQFLDLRGKDLA